jgi:hypothetical protein
VYPGDDRYEERCLTSPLEETIEDEEGGEEEIDMIDPNSAGERRAALTRAIQDVPRLAETLYTDKFDGWPTSSPPSWGGSPPSKKSRSKGKGIKKSKKKLSRKKKMKRRKSKRKISKYKTKKNKYNQR